MRGARIADKIQEFYHTGTVTQPITASQTSHGNFQKVLPNNNVTINRSEIQS